MGFGTKLSINERIDGCVKDAPDILYTLSRIEPRGDDPIEIVSELPAAPDVDILLGIVMRWNEIQKHFGRDLRVYAWSYNTTVEKYLMGCVQNLSHIHVTVLPTYLKENKLYG